MDDSKKLRIMKALSEHLEGIDPANTDHVTGEPYEESYAGKVYRGRTRFGNETARPFYSVLEAPKPTEPNASRGGRGADRKSTWNLLVQGFAVDDKDNPTDPTYQMLALLEARLARLIAVDEQDNPAFPDEFCLGGLVMHIVIGEGIVRPSDPEVSPTAFCYLPVTVELTTNVLDPYAD